MNIVNVVIYPLTEYYKVFVLGRLPEPFSHALLIPGKGAIENEAKYGKFKTDLRFIAKKSVTHIIVIQIFLTESLEILSAFTLASF